MDEGLEFVLETLEVSLDEIIKSNLISLKLINPAKKSQTLYHYTDLEGLQNIITNKSFFFSNSAFLNDKQEFTKGSETFVNIIEKELESEDDIYINAIFSKLLTKISSIKKSERYVACFSTKGDLLSQWRAYSNDGKGVCIGFDYNKLKLIFEGIDSFPIIYKELQHIEIANIVLSKSQEFYLNKKKTICEQFSLSEDFYTDIISDEIYNQLSKYIGQFKHNAFDEEKEFRFEIKIDDDIDNNRDILYRCSRNNLFVPYIKAEINKKQELEENKINEKDIIFPIKEIFIGPSLNSELNKLSISSFLFKNGYDIKEIDIKESNVPYRI